MLEYWVRGQIEPNTTGLLIAAFMFCLMGALFARAESQSINISLANSRKYARWSFYMTGLGFLTLFVTPWPFLLLVSMISLKSLLIVFTAIGRYVFRKASGIREYYRFAFVRSSSDSDSSS